MTRLFALTLAALTLAAAPALAADRGYNQDTDIYDAPASVVDTNGDGRVNSWEYQDAFGAEDARDNFSTFDQDGDGAITPYEDRR